MPIKATRSLLNAALSGQLSESEFRKDLNFGFLVPLNVPGIDESLLNPRLTWASPEDYDAQAAKLVTMFAKNFAQYVPFIDQDVMAITIS